MAEEKKGKSAKDDKFSEYPLIREFIDSNESRHRDKLTETQYERKRLERIGKLKEIYRTVLKPLQDSKIPSDQSLLDEILTSPNAVGECILEWSYWLLNKNFIELISFAAYLKLLGTPVHEKIDMRDQLSVKIKNTSKNLLKKEMEAILNPEIDRLTHLSPGHIKARRKERRKVRWWSNTYEYNQWAMYHEDRTLLHALVQSHLPIAIFIALLHQISSDLITRASPLLDAGDRTVFFLAGRHSSEIIHTFIKKIDVSVLVKHFPDFSKARERIASFPITMNYVIQKELEPVQLFGESTERIKSVSDLSAALVNYILKDTENALQFLKTLRDDDHPSWFSLYIKGYQTAYQTLQESKQPDMAKSDLLLATMFHLSNRNFRINRTEDDKLLFDTLKLMLDRPASVIVGIMRAENNPQDITNVIELLKVYYNSLTEGAEKTKVRLKMLDYAEQLPKRQNKRVEEKKNSSEAEPLIPEEKETMEDAIISTTKEEEAAVTAVLHACNLEIPDEDLSLKETGTAIPLKLVAAKKQELILKENGQIFESIIEKIQFHLLLTDLESTSFLNWFRNMWRRFFPPPKSEADYFKEFVSFTVKDKLEFVSICIKEMEKVNRTSTTFKKLFKALKTNLEERRALLPEKLQKSATQSSASFLNLKVFKTDKEMEEKSIEIKTDQKPTNF